MCRHDFGYLSVIDKVPQLVGGGKRTEITALIGREFPVRDLRQCVECLSEVHELAMHGLSVIINSPRGRIGIEVDGSQFPQMIVRECRSQGLGTLCKRIKGAAALAVLVEGSDQLGPSLGRRRCIFNFSRDDLLHLVGDAFLFPLGEVVVKIRHRLFETAAFPFLGHAFGMGEHIGIEGSFDQANPIGTRTEARLVGELARRLDGVVAVENELTWRIDDTEPEAAPEA